MFVCGVFLSSISACPIVLACRCFVEMAVVLTMTRLERVDARVFVCVSVWVWMLVCFVLFGLLWIGCLLVVLAEVFSAIVR